jgi:hypothetical protein
MDTHNWTWVTSSGGVGRRLVDSPLCENTNKTQFLAGDYRTYYLTKPSNFWDPKQTLYSALRIYKLRLNVNATIGA